LIDTELSDTEKRKKNFIMKNALMPRLHITVLSTRKFSLSFEKTDFQVLKLKFNACSMKQAFYALNKLNIARA